MMARRRRRPSVTSWYWQQLSPAIRYGLAAALGATLASPFWLALVPKLAGCG